MNLAWHDLLWLLLPLAAASGWYAARREQRRSRMSPERKFSSDYFRGINFLLNEQPDKAIEVFTQMVEVNTETVETHLALGSLFRRRGETDRAIRMHQNLVDREDLSEEQRLQALAELGQDYLKAGLLDRAEAVFAKLRDSRLNDLAMRYLLEIYQQEKDWAKAVEAAKALPDHESLMWRKEVANFYCELATSALASSKYEETQKYLDEAFSINRRCVRASLVQGDLFAAQGQYEEAIDVWKRVESQDPIYLALVAERVMDAHSKLGRVEQGQTLLRSWLERHASLDLLDEVFHWELEKEGSRAAYDLDGSAKLYLRGSTVNGAPLRAAYAQVQDQGGNEFRTGAGR